MEKGYTWEEIKESASSLADSAVQKTKEWSELAQLQFALKMKESDLRETYRKLGKAYYESLRESGEATGDFSALLETADQQNQKIREFRESIERLKEKK